MNTILPQRGALSETFEFRLALACALRIEPGVLLLIVPKLSKLPSPIRKSCSMIASGHRQVQQGTAGGGYPRWTKQRLRPQDGTHLEATRGEKHHGVERH